MCDGMWYDIQWFLNVGRLKCMGASVDEGRFLKGVNSGNICESR